MSSEHIIELSNISKCYQGYKKPIHRLIQAFYKQKRKLYREFWALRDIDLSVSHGETVGIVGRNGSGKSTLLQIVAGTLAPSGGNMNINGRVSAILELGAGFNPEFSGRENARLNASIVGLSKEEIKERMPEIIEFSGLQDFIDQPVKTYSSGMYVRLAFSVSININPDLLIIDEALAVGDIKFQRKCFRKLQQLKEDGISIILVTHATDAVIAHCDRAVFLEKGRIQSIGAPKDVVNEYMEYLFVEDNPNVAKAAAGGGKQRAGPGLNHDPGNDGCLLRRYYNPSEYRWGNRAAEIIDFRVLDASGGEVEHHCTVRDELKIQMAVYFHQKISDIIYGLTIKTVDGVAVFGSNSEKETGRLDPDREGLVLVEFDVGMSITGGEYFFSLGVVARNDEGTEVVLDRRYDLFHIRVEDPVGNIGIANLPFAIRIGNDAVSA